MGRTVVVLSGAVSTGKSTLARRLVERYGGRRFSTRQLIVERYGGQLARERRRLQALGDELDMATGGAWVADGIAPEVAALPAEALVVVDSVRILDQVEALRRAFGRQIVHVHLAIEDEAALERRYAERRGREDVIELPSYRDVSANPTERAIEALADDADVVIDTLRSDAADVEVRVAAHLGLRARDTGRLVDVLVGGQYGSEGKGNVAFHLAPEYDVLVRSGGPNAGHRVYTSTGEQYTHRLLPSGTMAGEAHLVIAPGAVIDVSLLLREIADCDIEVSRLTIDRRAMIISPGDKRYEQRELVGAIGSTGQGGGAAVARRILERGKKDGGVRLAEDIPELTPYVGEAAELLEAAYARGKKVLLEGTQGTSLSLFHGDYPHVTSRDTTVPGCLAESGISPTRVRKVVMVCRTYPIRVEHPPDGDSGPLKLELNWDEIARRSLLDAEDLIAAERGSVSGKLRRVGEFDWSQLRRNAHLNGPTDIALTFADYIHKKNQAARRLDQLTPETVRFIAEVERVSGVPVSLISTRFHTRSVIDRRSW